MPVYNDNRLAKGGLLVDRSETVNFSFDGREFKGFAGDTIASALAANGQWLISRSFKYHRPRGALTMAGQDANTLVQLPSDPNVLADRETIRNGLNVSGQNFSGSLEKDASRHLGMFSKFMPVGFYYKAFYKPAGAWEKWAPVIRKAAGLGVLDDTFEPEYYDKQYRFYDLVVVGAGPAGMTAAIQAAEQGAKVLLVDENPILGGSLAYSRLDAEGTQAEALRQAMIADIESHTNIEVKLNAVCNGYFGDNWFPVIQGKRLYKVRTKEAIMCVGSLEQQAVFHNNDLPGVMMSSAVQRLIKLYGVKPGQKAVVVTGNDEGYACVLDMLDAGIEVAAVAELRDAAPESKLMQAVSQRGVRILSNHAVYAATSSSDKKHLASVEIRQQISKGQCANNGEIFACDLLCMAVGYTPTYQLICQAGGQLSYNDDTAMFTLSKLPKAFQIAGSVNANWSTEAVCGDAQRAAVIAVNRLAENVPGVSAMAEPAPIADDSVNSPNYSWPIFPHPKGKEFVDFDEDLQIKDIVNATRDGYEHVQLVKRYSTCGMGPSQGRHSALATARIVANATGKSVAQTGVTTARPPFAPERLGHLAGRSFYPARYTNMHHRHLEAGAQMLQAGAWFRPAYYGATNQRDNCIAAEVNNVRNNVGLVDVSTLGGIEVRGPDAGEFLNRVYTFGFVKQPLGRARYALMTNEAGVVIDDGVSCRFHDQLFYVTATTGGVDRVYQSMLKWNAQWCLDVDIANVTSAWCGVNIAGPKAREVLSKLCDDIDLSSEAFPYMGVREGHVAGVQARVIRVGFVGELGYEVHVPQHAGEALWDALMAAGEEQGIKPFGIEAQRVLRLEKGHIIIGQDTDAMSTPEEVQMGWAVSNKKPFFVGQRIISELNKAPQHRALVGFVVDDANAPLPQESHLIFDGEKMTGRITSCNYSPTLGKPVGMAYVPPGKTEPGSEITIKVDSVRVTAKVVALPFYDPDTARQNL